MNGRWRTLWVAGLLTATLLLPSGASAGPEIGVGDTQAPLGWTLEESRLADLSALAGDGGALGIYLDTTKEELVIVLPSGANGQKLAADAGKIGLSVRVEHRDINAETVELVYGRLEEVYSDPSLGGGAYVFYFDPALGKIAVSGAAPARVFEALLGPFAKYVEYRQGDVRRLSRHADTEPFWGGAEVRDNAGSLYDCTTGFSVKNASGTRFMTTAGHCFTLNEEVFSPGNGLRMGKITNRAAFPQKDMELIGTETYGTRIYVGGAAGGSLPVNGAGNPVVGFANYCHSGASTFENCGHRVTSLNGQFCDAAGCTPDLAVFRDGVLPVGGDSGSPFYVRSTDNTSVGMRGMVIARNFATNDVYAHKWTTIRDTFGVSIVTGT